MKVTWYTAPIAALIGKKGANIGHELTFASPELPLLYSGGWKNDMQGSDGPATTRERKLLLAGWWGLI